MDPVVALADEIDRTVALIEQAMSDAQDAVDADSDEVGQLSLYSGAPRVRADVAFRERRHLVEACRVALRADYQTRALALTAGQAGEVAAVIREVVDGLGLDEQAHGRAGALLRVALAKR
jgi:hypothetical protein